MGDSINLAAVNAVYDKGVLTLKNSGQGKVSLKQSQDYDKRGVELIVLDSSGREYKHSYPEDSIRRVDYQGGNQAERVDIRVNASLTADLKGGNDEVSLQAGDMVVIFSGGQKTVTTKTIAGLKLTGETSKSNFDIGNIDGNAFVDLQLRGDGNKLTVAPAHNSVLKVTGANNTVTAYRREFLLVDLNGSKNVLDIQDMLYPNLHEQVTVNANGNLNLIKVDALGMSIRDGKAEKYPFRYMIKSDGKDNQLAFTAHADTFSKFTI